LPMVAHYISIKAIGYPSLDLFQSFLTLLSSSYFCPPLARFVKPAGYILRLSVSFITSTMFCSTASRLVKYKSISLDQLQTTPGSVLSGGVEAASNAVEQNVKAIYSSPSSQATPN
jgi:hypothetical protein